jgi:crossover junction endodeoxyribonuclease RuvC
MFTQMQKMHNKNTIRILAIDPGFDRVGMAVLECDSKKKESLVFSSCIQTISSFPLHARIRTVGEEIKKIIVQYRPSALAVESLIFNTNQKTAMGVAHARGVIMYEASSHDLEIYEYTPLQIKVAVTGYGRASKEQVIEMVERLIEIPPLSKNKKRLDDEYDAIAIGLTHAAHVRG